VTVNGQSFSKNRKIDNRDEITINILVEKLDEILPEDL
jgi:hypothetical protein